MNINPLTCCIIIGAAEVTTRPKTPEGAYIIAADGGADTAARFGIVPDLILGDFDSVKKPEDGAGFDNLPYESADPKKIPDAFDASVKLPAGTPLPTYPERPRTRVLRFPVEKDDTDTMLSIRTGFRAGCDTFLIYGGTGGRADHTIANIQTLNWIARHGCRGYLIGSGRIYTAVCRGRLVFAPGGTGATGQVSVFCSGAEATGVTLAGLKYTLNDSGLTDDVPLGVSNEFKADESAVIAVGDGTLLVTWEDEDLDFDGLMSHTCLEW